MKVYVFGNPDFEGDILALKVAEEIKDKLKDVEFVLVNPNEDLPFVGEKNVYILDAVQGIEKITILNEKDLDKIKLEKSVTAHDYDLSFQLKYLKKLGKLKSFTIIGLPQNEEIDNHKLIKLLESLCHSELDSESV